MLLVRYNKMSFKAWFTMRGHSAEELSASSVAYGALLHERIKIKKSTMIFKSVIDASSKIQ